MAGTRTVGDRRRALLAMLYNLDNPYDVPKFEADAKRLLEERALVEMKRKNPRRTLSQNSYLHVLTAYFAAEYGCSADEAKVDYYKRTCNRDLFERHRTNRRGGEVRYLRSSSELDTAEMTLSIDRFRTWSASVAGIYLPSPEDHQLLIYAQQEIERNKEYI